MTNANLMPPTATNQFTIVAADDLLWVQDSVPWSPGHGSISGLIVSAAKFIEFHRITVVKGGVAVAPTVTSPYTLEFKGFGVSNATEVGVQGIDNSSRISVRTSIGPVIPPEAEPSVSTMASAAPSLPTTSPILVTLVPQGGNINQGRAYLHWEISPNAPTDPTSPQELVDHVQMSLHNSASIISEYKRRLKVPYIDAEVVYANRMGDPIQPQPAAKDIVVEYSDNRSLSCECTEGGPVNIVSCNVDIGNYTIGPNGEIIIVVDTTTVKFY